MITFAQHPHSPDYDEQGNPVSAVDWQGNRFHLGQLVYYCIGAGRGQLMAVGTVVKIRVKDGESWNGETKQFVEVSVHTRKTAGSWDNKERSKPTWVNPINITAPVDPNLAGTA